jgi:acid stress-induced BolA-like protein IbaG/YrbA
MNSDDIKILIENSIEDSVALVSSNDNVHFDMIVISDAFNERSLIERHQMVYECLGKRMNSEIHALTIKALTPAENS